MNKTKIIKDLKKQNDEIEKKKNSIYYERVYVNLPITLLERTFFTMYVESVKQKQVDWFREHIKLLMNQNPDILTKAKSKIKKDYKNAR